MPQIEKPEFKYNLKERVDNMTRAEWAEFFGSFEDKVGATVRTFYNWAAIPFDSDQYIPEEKLQALGDYLDIEPACLKNFEVIPKQTI